MPRGTPLSVALAVASCLLAVGGAHAVDPGSQLIGCELADTRVTISVSSHLDPACTWTRGVEIVASDVTLDCQGALIANPERRNGIEVVVPTDVALSNVTVRNCHIDGFLNSIRLTREGFRDLPAGVEYDHAWSDIVVEDGSMRNSRGVGIFVDGYVTGVTLRRLHIENTGSAGIYLETGSKDNVVEDNVIVDNGYSENGPDGQFFDIAGVTFWFWGIGREGLAIDGSRNNVVRNNRFSGNSAGGIFLYKNCGEFPERDRYFERRYGAHGNLIEGNTFAGEDNGVWVGSRMGENTTPMLCTDPQYAPGYALDHAQDNTVRGNVFEDVVYGVRVEDDRATVEDNIFTSDDPAHVAVLLGTPVRTSVLGLPVDGTRVVGNAAAIAGSKNPYRWVHGHVNTTFADNRSLGGVVGLCEGEPPARGPFVMTVAVAVADPENPPTGEDPVLPPPSPLPPCPTACEAGVAATAGKLVVSRLTTPPGDVQLQLRGELSLAHPFDPPLDPVETGVAIVVADATGARVLDVQLPGGAYDPVARAGWKTVRAGERWRYQNRSATPPGGIRSVVLRDLSARRPGVVDFRVTGKQGAYPVVTANLPLSAIVSVDPPTAETGQCGHVTFDAAGAACAVSTGRVTCRAAVR
jgi:parallel beta-helix repeat protein